MKNLYNEKYEAYKQSEKYKLINILQIEANKAKKICKEQAKYICAICGAEAIDAHHIDPIENNQNNNQSNLICLCRKCHQQVHKGVYKIDMKTREVTIGKVDEIKPDDKLEYVKEFEKKLGIEIYKKTGKYYGFINGVKTQFTAAEMKAAVGYKAPSYHTEMSEEKRQNIKDRKLLKQWKQLFKESKNSAMWHQLCRIINAWDSLDKLQKDHIFEVLHKNFGSDFNFDAGE